MNSAEGQALWDAYGDTDYVVHDEDGRAVVIRIGRTVPEGMGPGAIVTAWNPGSKQRDPAENQAASTRLATWISRHGLKALPCRTRPADPAWAEEGWLILGIDEVEALALARMFGQNALVRVEPGDAARLVATALWDKD
jgi:hypothetical protein